MGIFRKRNLPGGKVPRVVWVALAAALLAAVVFIASALSQPATDEDRSPAGSGETLEALLSQAARAQDSGDSTRAVSLLERALVLSPNDPRAALSLSRLKASSSQEPDGQEPSAESTSALQDPDAGFELAVADLALLLPRSAQGWLLGVPESSATDIALPADPQSPGPATRVVFSVHDLGDSKAARAFIENTSKGVYGRDAEQVTVQGVPAYFGTDGSRFASVAYVRGRYAFEVIMTSTSGVAPSALRALALSAASAFPDVIE